MSDPSESEDAAERPLERLSPADRATLFSGPISEADLRQLERRAEREPEIARALAYLRPLDQGFHQRVLHAVRRDRSPRRGRSLAAAGLAVACAGLLVFFMPSFERASPSFTFEVEAGWHVDRAAGAPSAGPERSLEAGAPIVILARPARAVVEELELSAFCQTASGWQRLGGRTERSPSGSIRLRARWPAGGTHPIAVILGPRSIEEVPLWLDEGQPGFQIELLGRESTSMPPVRR